MATSCRLACTHRFMARVHGAAAWRKVAGVEPTGKRLTSPTGFEARPHHRMRMPSEFADEVRCIGGSVLVVPTAVDTQHPGIDARPSWARALGAPFRAAAWAPYRRLGARPAIARALAAPF